MWLPMTSPASQDVPAVIQTLRPSNKENGGMMKHQTEEGDYPLCTWGLPDRGLSGMDKQARRNIGCPIEVSLTVAEVFVCLSGPRMQARSISPRENGAMHGLTLRCYLRLTMAGACAS
mmetsp:Transcript_63165/g.112272  ORF Transcript_63165/g.112272 Transcript_63165/m.112272 type:complete len:118 (+) Transcript_63165:336-689(+)